MTILWVNNDRFCLKIGKNWTDWWDLYINVHLLYSSSVLILVVSICIIFIKENVPLLYSWFHIKGTLSVHFFNGDYLSIPKCTGRCGYLFHEIPGIWHNYFSFTWKNSTQKYKFKNKLIAKLIYICMHMQIQFIPLLSNNIFYLFIQMY